jgi:hypothetical protein
MQVLNKLRKMPPVSKGNPAEVEQRIDDYFKLCEETKMPPSVEGLTLACGVSRVTLLKWQNDGYSEAGRIIARAKSVINACISTAALSGRLNPVYAIWQQKSNFQMSEKVSEEIAESMLIEKATQSQDLTIEQQLAGEGLVWDDSKQEFIDG